MNKIYQYITDNGILLPHHKDELQKRRGFNDQTITEGKFFSAGKHFIDFEEPLKKEFTTDELTESGVFINDGKDNHISPILLEERIVIPYLNKEGKTIFIRPHKLGLKGVPIEIYQEYNIRNNPMSIIMTEGEFKAAAGQQLGFPTIAVPGVGSFSDQHFPRLAKLLHDHKVRDICIIFDNEVKDDPAFPERYKDEPLKRYDSHYYAYYMSYKLDKEGFDARISWLPDTWRISGKADIDGALAQGKTAEDFKRIISQSKTYKIFLNDLGDEAQNVIKKKKARRFFKSHIRKEFGKYVASRKRGKLEYDETISNFTIKIIATHNTPEGIMRELQFIDEFGVASHTFSMSAEDMSGVDSFKKFCLNKGNYVWRGLGEDLNNIWEDEFLNDDGRHIFEPDHIGWVSGEGWLFGNVFFHKDGTEIRADRNHIFWTDKKGIKPIALGVTSGRNTVSEGIPYLNLNNFDISEFKDKLSDTIGEMEACLSIGWITAVLFMEEVFDNYGCFPFLFVTGRRGSGKSSIAEWLMEFFGLENAGKMAEDTTAVGIQRYLSYYSSLPVYLDEFRNTKLVMMKNGFLRNAYNRQSAGKGVKSNFGVREAKIRGTLLLAGEETPEDNALLTRCITILVSERSRKTNHFNWFMANRGKFSNHTLKTIRGRKESLEVFMKVLNEGKNFFVKKGADDRTAINYAVVSAGYAVVFGEKDINFAKWLTNETKRVKEEYQNEQVVSAFLEDLIALRTRKLINSDYWEISEGKIHLYFHGLYAIWSTDHRRQRGTEPFKASAIRDYLKEEPGFVEIGAQKKINGINKKCVVFDAELAPEVIKSLVQDSNQPDFNKPSPKNEKQATFDE